MSLFHAVLWLDHHEAKLLQFDADHVETERLRAHSHHTKQHGSAVRSEHEFFAEVCAALQGITEVLVTGSTTWKSTARSRWGRWWAMNRWTSSATSSWWPWRASTSSSTTA